MIFNFRKPEDKKMSESCKCDKEPESGCELFKLTDDWLIDLSILAYARKKVITTFYELEQLQSYEYDKAEVTRYMLTVKLDTNVTDFNVYFKDEESLNKKFDELTQARL